MHINPLIIRWETIAAVLAFGAVVVWALGSKGAARDVDRGASLERKMIVEIRRPGKPPELAQLEGSSLLGRARECGIVFDDAEVSKWHARLHFDGQQASLEDLNSTNGTTLNGRRIEAVVPLRRGDRIGLGANQITFAGIAVRQSAGQ